MYRTNRISMKNQVAICILVLLVAALLTACKDEEFEAATIEVLRPAEYTTRTTTPLEYVTCATEDVSLSAEKDLDTTQVGAHTVEITLEKGRNSRTEEVEILVKDTMPPRIELKSAEATIEMGEDFDPLKLVANVSDPVDGDLESVREQPKPMGTVPGEEVFYDEGWYVVSGDSDFTKPGTYKAVIEAENKHGNKAEETISVKVTDPLEGVTLSPSTSVLEYSKKPTDPVKLVTCSVKDAEVTAGQLDLSKVGKVTVEYTIKKGASTHTQKVEYEVRDTKSPTIALKADELAVDFGASFDPYANVASVTDEVDGALTRVDAEPTANGDGWYTVTGSYDTKVPSKYFFTVIASDRNGNRVTKEYSLVVKDQPVAATAPKNTQAAGSGVEDSPTVEEASTEASSAQDYVLNTNTFKFHYPRCRHVNTIYDENRQDVHMTREEILAQGYVPCAHCNP